MKAKLTLTRSLIGRKPNQVATAKTLGLNKIGDSTVIELSPTTAGKVNTIRHLLTIENIK